MLVEILNHILYNFQRNIHKLHSSRLMLTKVNKRRSLNVLHLCLHLSSIEMRCVVSIDVYMYWIPIIQKEIDRMIGANTDGLEAKIKQYIGPNDRRVSTFSEQGSSCRYINRALEGFSHIYSAENLKIAKYTYEKHLLSSSS